MIRASKGQASLSLQDKLKENEETYLALMDVTGQNAAEAEMEDPSGGIGESNLNYAVQAAYDNYQMRLGKQLSSAQFANQGV